MSRQPSSKPLSFWLHGLLLALPLGMLGPALALLETPLPDGVYRAVRGYNAVTLHCPERIEIEGVKIADGTISFQSGDVAWQGVIDREYGIIRIEAAGIAPRPTGDVHVRGHHSKARLYSDFCGSGYFRILRETPTRP